MAKFIKSKFRVVWGTIFSFFYGIFATDISAQEAADNSNDETGSSVEEPAKEESLDPGAIAAAVAAAAALIAAGGDNASPAPAPIISIPPASSPAAIPNAKVQIAK